MKSKKTKLVLVISPVIISNGIMGPINNEKELVRVLSDYRETHLVIGINFLRFRSRTVFARQTLGTSLNRRVYVLPMFEMKYLVVLGKLVFAFLSSMIMLYLRMTRGLECVIIRDSCVPPIVSFVSKVARVPYVYRAVSTPFSSSEVGVYDASAGFPGLMQKALRGIMWVFDLIALSRASMILTSSPSAEGLILSRVAIPRDRIVLVPYFIPDFFFKEGQPRHTEAGQSLRNEAKLVYFGSMNEYYNFDMLLEAICDLKDRSCRVTLSIYGSGPKRAHILNRAEELGIKESVVVNGPVTRTEVPHLCASAAAAVVPYSSTLERGVSLKSIEAMALGVPVIISKRCDPLYVDGYNCLILREDTAAQWKGAIERAKQPGVRQKLVPGGFQTARPFQQQVVAERIRRVLDSIPTGA